MTNSAADASIKHDWPIPAESSKARCHVYGCDNQAETLIVIRMPHRSLFDCKVRGEDRIENVAPATATISICQSCARAMVKPPCEDCGHAPCDCDQMRAADELLYGGEEEADYLSDDDSFDEPHGEECCCEDCLQDYPERDALYNDSEFYGAPSDGTVAMLCSYPGCDAIAEIIAEGEPIPAGSMGRKHVCCPKHEADERRQEHSR